MLSFKANISFGAMQNMVGLSLTNLLNSWL